jgi:hypothetical protein
MWWNRTRWITVNMSYHEVRSLLGSQKTLNFILAAMRTWNLTCPSMNLCIKAVPLLMQALLILDLCTKWGCGQCHAPVGLYPGNGLPGTGGWMDLTSGLDTEARGKIFCLCRGLNPNRPVCSQTLLTELHRCIMYFPQLCCSVGSW